MTRCFARWRREIKDCLDLQEIADQKRNEKDVDLMQDSFANWSERMQSVLKLKVVAIDFRRRQLLRYELEEMMSLTPQGLF